MRTIQQKLAILAFMALGLMTSVIDVHAQFSDNVIDTGKVVPNVTLTDINGKQIDLYTYLDQGYMVAIELSMTTCTICWAFHEEGVFENIYKQYGPNGTVKAKKILPIYMECNPSTTSADLHGKGPNTVGDWVTGVTHPIVDLTSSNYVNVLTKFLKPGKMSFPTPTFFLICPDRKVVFSDEGGGALWEEMLVDMMDGRCKAGGKPTGIVQTMPKTAQSIYPNPAHNILNVKLEALTATPVTFLVCNIVGQTLIKEQATLAHGIQETALNISMLPAGMYLLNIVTEQGIIQEKFVVER